MGLLLRLLLALAASLALPAWASSLPVLSSSWAPKTASGVSAASANEGHTYFVGDLGAWVHNGPCDIHPSIPGKPFTGKGAPDLAKAHLEANHGVAPATTGNRLHKLKASGGIAPDADVAIGKTGDVYNAATGEWLGTLTDPSLGQ